MLSLPSDYSENDMICYSSSSVANQSLKEETPMEKNYIVYSPSYGCMSQNHKTEDVAWESAKKFAASTKRSDIQVFQSLGYVKQPIPEFDVVKF